MQGPGGPDEDRSGGFTPGGWLVPPFDEDAGWFMIEVFEQVDAFLLGRRTYDIFAASWPKATDPDDPVASRLNTLPKYVASTTLTSPEWGPTTVLTGDVPDAVAQLKKQPGESCRCTGAAGCCARCTSTTWWMSTDSWSSRPLSARGAASSPIEG
jgi:dihydrofolate reductase